jgi:UDPglucose 6-dehydrogenase
MTFLCVGTPSLPTGAIDLSFLKEATKQVATILKNKESWHLIVVKSTVVPGTTQDIVLPLLEKHSRKKVGSDIGLAMNPEFLKEGVAIQDFFNPDRIVIGSADTKSKKILRELYKDFSCPLVETTPSAAEMIKYASNCFLATKISFINEIGNLCKTLGIDTYEVADGMGLDKRIGRAFLDSGIGWGGSCFGKDVNALIALAKEKQTPCKIMDSAVWVNDQQPLRVITLLQKHIPNLTGKTIGILGLSFKPNTDDIRDSRAIPIVQTLLQHHAQVKAFDPQAMDAFRQQFPQITYCSSAQEVLDSDALLLLTNWDEFKKLDYRNSIVIDGRRSKRSTKSKGLRGSVLVSNQ